MAGNNNKPVESWGRVNLKARKEEFHRVIKAFVADQCPDASAREHADMFGCSMGTVYMLRKGRLDIVSLDMLYTIAMNLDLGPQVYIPTYGSYMG